MAYCVFVGEESLVQQCDIGAFVRLGGLVVSLTCVEVALCQKEPLEQIF